MERTSSLFGCRFEWETAKKMQFSSVIAVALPKHHNKYSDSMHWASSEWTSRRPLYVTSTSYIVEFPIQWRYSFSACVCFTNIPRSQSWCTYNIAKAGTTEKGDGRCDRNRGVHTKTWTEFLFQHFWPEHVKEQTKQKTKKNNHNSIVASTLPNEFKCLSEEFNVMPTKIQRIKYIWEEENGRKRKKNHFTSYIRLTYNV